MEDFIFTPENLIANISKLGGWSCYGLAEVAIDHYYPEIAEIEDSLEKLAEQVRVTKNHTWQYWIKKYHKEVGYEILDPAVVNAY